MHTDKCQIELNRRVHGKKSSKLSKKKKRAKLGSLIFLTSLNEIRAVVDVHCSAPAPKLPSFIGAEPCFMKSLPRSRLAPGL